MDRLAHLISPANILLGGSDETFSGKPFDTLTKDWFAAEMILSVCFVFGSKSCLKKVK